MTLRESELEAVNCRKNREERVDESRSEQKYRQQNEDIHVTLLAPRMQEASFRRSVSSLVNCFRSHGLQERCSTRFCQFAIHLCERRSNIPSWCFHCFCFSTRGVRKRATRLLMELKMGIYCASSKWKMMFRHFGYSWKSLDDSYLFFVSSGALSWFQIRLKSVCLLGIPIPHLSGCSENTSLADLKEDESLEVLGEFLLLNLSRFGLWKENVRKMQTEGKIKERQTRLWRKSEGRASCIMQDEIFALLLLTS